MKKTEVNENDIEKIDVMADLTRTKKGMLSAIASSIDYCVLETNDQCLITGNNIHSSGDFFVSTYGNFCYVFDRKNGNFVRQISNIGQGPDEYQLTISVLTGEKGQICLLGNNQFLFFNLDGTLSHKIKNFNPDVAFSFVAYEDLYVGYVVNRRGNATIRIAFFDNATGALIDSIPNYRFYERSGGIPSSGGDFSFHIFNNNLYYKDIYCDTLYQIKDFTLHPRYIFNTGSRTVPYEAQIEGKFDNRAAMTGGEWDRYAKYIVIDRIIEDAYFLYFTFDYRMMKYPAFYHKAEKTIQIMPPVSLPPPPRFFPYPLYGFENDLDGGLPFWPQQMISDTEMMCVYQADELLGLDTSKITNEKLKKVLSNLEADSNPVVAIVTLKK